MSYTIYIITNTVTGKQYIGQTIKSISQRFTKHKQASKSVNTHLYNSFNKYGINNFIIEPILHCNDKNLLNYLETFCIKVYDTYKNGYNMTLGGDDNPMNNPISRNKISGENNGMYGKKQSDYVKSQISKANTGRKFSKQQRINMKKLSFNYHTPSGVFFSISDVEKEFNIPRTSLLRWYKNPDKIISKGSISQSKYLKKHTLGKTFREIGFYPIHP